MVVLGTSVHHEEGSSNEHPWFPPGDDAGDDDGGRPEGDGHAEEVRRGDRVDEPGNLAHIEGG